MKKFIVLIITTFCISLGLFSQSSDNDSIKNEKTTSGKNTSATDYQKGITAYNQGDYYKSIEFFQKELKTQDAKSLESPILYYNLGNAYFKVNNFGKARLYYEKALVLDPNMENAKLNISFIENKIHKSVTLDDDFLLFQWMKQLSNEFSANTWCTLGIITFIILLINVAVFFFSGSILVKKIVFYIGLFFLIVCVFSNIFAYQRVREIEVRNSAIVLSPVILYTSPDTSSKQVMELDEARKVKITKNDKNWIEVKLSDGTTGWIQSNKIEVI